MKPCIPDGKDSVQIAKSISKRCLKKENKLESLLELRFTKKLVSVNIETINDFPQLTLKQLKNRITFGSFKLRQCLSYVGQVIDYGKAFFIQENMIEKYITHPKIKKELQYCKIISVQIPSRHKRGKKWKPKSNPNEDNNVDPKSFTHSYKVFIQYVPFKQEEGNCLNQIAKPYRLIKSK